MQQMSLIVLAAAAALAGCAPPETPRPTDPSATRAIATPTRPIVVDASHVEDCQFLASITKNRYSGIIFAGNGILLAQGYVIDEAASIGATHVVWGSMSGGGAVQSATGSAYRCAAV